MKLGNIGNVIQTIDKGFKENDAFYRSQITEIKVKLEKIMDKLGIVNEEDKKVL